MRVTGLNVANLLGAARLDTVQEAMSASRRRWNAVTDRGHLLAP
jgi:hypothetical protein